MNPLRIALAWLALGWLFLRELLVSVKDVVLTILQPRRMLVTRAALDAIRQKAVASKKASQDVG